MKECEDLKQKNCQLSDKLEKLKSEMEYIEQAFFRGDENTNSTFALHINNHIMSKDIAPNCD